MKKKPTTKRFLAYIVDILIIGFITSMFAEIEFLNPNYDDYKNTVEEYNIVYSEMLNNPTQVDEALIQDYTYDIAKLSLPTSIISLVLTILYFVVFQYFNKGQTIGKKLFKIKVVSEDGNNPSFIQVLVRGLIIYSIITSFVLVILIALTNKTFYINASQYVSLVDMGIIFVSIGLIMFRPDGCGLHDLIVHTNVVFESDIEVEKVENVKKKNVKQLKSKTKKVKDANIVDEKDE